MPRNPNKHRTPEQQLEIAEYVKTHSVKDTMRRYRLTDPQVRQIMHRHGVRKRDVFKETKPGKDIFNVFENACWVTGGNFNGRGKILS